jgi:hypothetical protein
MAKTRITKVLEDYKSGVVSEDGVHYRHERQEMDPVIDHVKFLSQKVNTAPKAGNRNDMHYVGSLPLTVLIDWCNKKRITIDQYARSKGLRKKFIKYVTENFPKFMAEKKKSSQILMPGGDNDHKLWRA